MSIGGFTKQFAQEALKSSAKDMLDAMRPPELASIAEAITGAKPNAPPAVSENVGATILGQIQAMQKALKEEDELVVLCGTGLEVLQVLEIFLPSWRVAVLSGIDTDRNITRVVAPVEQLVLTCKVMRAPANTKPSRIRIVAPRA